MLPATLGSMAAPAKYGEAADLGEVVKTIGKHGVRAVAVTGNIGDAAAVAKMRSDIEAKHGAVDVLVNCAGGDIGAAGCKPKPNNALDIPIEDVQALVNNNLVGTIIVCKAFVVPMRERGAGVVINLAPPSLITRAAWRRSSTPRASSSTR